MYKLGIRAETISDREAIIRLEIIKELPRPGETVAGPFIMVLADVAMYAVVVSNRGGTKMAVTTNLNINFLRRSVSGTLRAYGLSLKLGKRLAVIDVTIYSDLDEAPIAQATGTYSLQTAIP